MACCGTEKRIPAKHLHIAHGRELLWRPSFHVEYLPPNVNMHVYRVGGNSNRHNLVVSTPSPTLAPNSESLQLRAILLKPAFRRHLETNVNIWILDLRAVLTLCFTLCECRVAQCLRVVQFRVSSSWIWTWVLQCFRRHWLLACESASIRSSSASSAAPPRNCKRNMRKCHR